MKNTLAAGLNATRELQVDRERTIARLKRKQTQTA